MPLAIALCGLALPAAARLRGQLPDNRLLVDDTASNMREIKMDNVYLADGPAYPPPAPVTPAPAPAPASSGAAPSNVQTCDGETRWDFKCKNDDKQRVCARLLDSDGQKVKWGQQDYWTLTQQPDGSNRIGIDKTTGMRIGGNTCIDMWSIASIVQSSGCDAVQMVCTASDVSYIVSQYGARQAELGTSWFQPAIDCMQTKCTTTAGS